MKLLLFFGSEESTGLSRVPEALPQDVNMRPLLLQAVKSLAILRFSDDLCALCVESLVCRRELRGTLNYPNSSWHRFTYT